MHKGRDDPLLLASEAALKRDTDLLEESALKLLLQQCECDCKAWHVYQAKRSNYEKAIYSETLE
eukprot:5358383-Alexandrium_andersonii.AAC.1